MTGNTQAHAPTRVFTFDDAIEHHLAALSFRASQDGADADMLAPELADLSLYEVPVHFDDSFITFATQDDTPVITVEVWEHEPEPTLLADRTTRGRVESQVDQLTLLWSTSSAGPRGLIPGGPVEVAVQYPDLRAVEAAADAWLRAHVDEPLNPPVFETWTIRLWPAANP